MALKHFIPPEIKRILKFIDQEKENIQYAVCDFYFGLYEIIEWTNYLERDVIANGINENRDSLLEIIEKEMKHLESKVIEIPKIREEIIEFAEKKLAIKRIEQPDLSNENSTDSE